MKFERHIKMKIHNQLNNISNLKESNTHENNNNKKKNSKMEHKRAKTKEPTNS